MTAGFTIFHVSQFLSLSKFLPLTESLRVFQRTVAPRKRRKLELDQFATHGLWSFNLGAIDEEKQTILISSDVASTKVSLEQHTPLSIGY